MQELNYDKLENILLSLLQSRIELKFGNRKWKSGKFILFKTKNFYLQLYIENINKNKIECLEVPIPFKISSDSQYKILTFDYKLDNMNDVENKLYTFLENNEHSKKSKFYNTELTIKVKDDE